MSPQAQTSKKRFIVQPNMCAGGPRQPPFKGGGKPGAGVRPPALNEKNGQITFKNGGPHTGARFVSTLERRLPGTAHIHVAVHDEASFLGQAAWRYC